MKIKFSILLLNFVLFYTTVYGSEERKPAPAQVVTSEVASLKKNLQILQAEIVRLKQRIEALEKQLTMPEWRLKTGNLIIYTLVEPFMINPVAKDNLRIASIHLHLALSSEAVRSSITQKNQKSKIRNSMIALYSSKTVEQIRAESHTKIRDELRDTLNAFLGEGAVLDVYYQDLVIQ